MRRKSTGSIGNPIIEKTLDQHKKGEEIRCATTAQGFDERRKECKKPNPRTKEDTRWRERQQKIDKLDRREREIRDVVTD